MTITISDGVDEFTPLLVTGYEAGSESGNIVHEIIGRPGDPDYSLGDESPRDGSLPMMFRTAADCAAAVAILSRPAIFTLVDDETPEVDMTFIRQGAMRRRRGRTRGSWLLDVGFVEVLA
jgi:hypothetical protein